MVAREGVSEATLKALTEHFVYLAAQRLGKEQAVIMGGPHDTTTDTAINQTTYDAEHITAELSGGAPGRRKVHVYLGGKGTGETAYDNVWATSEGVTRRTNQSYIPDQDLSAQFSEPELDTTYNRMKRYNYTTQAWEWC